MIFQSWVWHSTTKLFPLHQHVSGYHRWRSSLEKRCCSVNWQDWQCHWKWLQNENEFIQSWLCFSGLHQCMMGTVGSVRYLKLVCVPFWSTPSEEKTCLYLPTDQQGLVRFLIWLNACNTCPRCVIMWAVAPPTPNYYFFLDFMHEVEIKVCISW